MDQAVIRTLAVALFGASAAAWAAGDATTRGGVTAVPSAPGFNLSDKDQRLTGIRGRDEVMLHNPDAAFGARLWLTPGKASRAFVYADVGATNSDVKWQGLAGIHASHGIDLFGGWRRVTDHYASGVGFDSLDFDGPFVGATLAL